MSKLIVGSALQDPHLHSEELIGKNFHCVLVQKLGCRAEDVMHSLWSKNAITLQCLEGVSVCGSVCGSARVVFSVHVFLSWYAAFFL